MINFFISTTSISSGNISGNNSVITCAIIISSGTTSSVDGSSAITTVITSVISSTKRIFFAVGCYTGIAELAFIIELVDALAAITAFPSIAAIRVSGSIDELTCR